MCPIPLNSALRHKCEPLVRPRDLSLRALPRPFRPLGPSFRPPARRHKCSQPRLTEQGASPGGVVAHKCSSSYRTPASPRRSGRDPVVATELPRQRSRHRPAVVERPLYHVPQHPKTPLSALPVRPAERSEWSGASGGKGEGPEWLGNPSPLELARLVLLRPPILFSTTKSW